MSPLLGLNTRRLFYDKLKVKSVKELEKFARAGKLLGLQGVKEKTVGNILKGVALFKKGRERINLASALKTADKFIKPFKNLRAKNIPAGHCAGCARRWESTKSCGSIRYPDKNYGYSPASDIKNVSIRSYQILSDS